jgi:serine/threonine-protein kinase
MSDAKDIDAICNDFEDDWQKSGKPPDFPEPPDLRAYLESAREGIRNALFIELIAIDAHYQKRRGPPRSYDREFPEYWHTEQVPAPFQPQLNDGKSIDKYRIVTFLDRGAQAEVYRAQHQTLNRSVIIKLWSGDQFDSPETAEAVLHEGRILVGLPPHPSLPQVYDCDIFEGCPYLVFEDVKGCTLKDWLNLQRPTLDARIDVMRQIAAATAWLHQRNVVHQDLKPGNILICPIDESGKSSVVRVKLIDFGLATWHSIWNPSPTERIAGTPGYMAPEIATYFLEHADSEGAPQAALNESGLDPQRTDVFSLGCVLYYLTTEKSPYPKGNGESRLDYVKRCAEGEYDTDPLQKLRKGRRYAGLCRRALSLNPHDRPTAAQFLRELRWIQSAPLLAGISAAAILLLAGALTLFSILQSPQAPVATVEFVYRDQIDPNRPFRLSSELVPLYPGQDKLSLEWSIPPRHAAASFLISPSGDIRLDRQWPSTSEPQLRRPGMSNPDGEPGTAGVFVCTIRGTRIPVAAIEEAWKAAEAKTHAATGKKWPALPSVLLRISDSGAREDAQTLPRDADGEKAFYAVRDRLNSFCKELRHRSVSIGGIAFPQAEPPN